MVKISSIEANEDFTILVKLDNGKSGILDINEYLDKGVFKELRDLEYFKQVKNFGRYIAWPHEQDLCADSIAASLQ
jgi:hypothetical protein